MTTLVGELERSQGRFGLQTMCEGGGQPTSHRRALVVKMLWLAAALAFPAAARAQCEGFESVLERDNTHVYSRKIAGSPHPRAVRHHARGGAAGRGLRAPPRRGELFRKKFQPTVLAEKIFVERQLHRLYMVIDPGSLRAADYCIATHPSVEGRPAIR